MLGKEKRRTAKVRNGIMTRVDADRISKAATRTSHPEKMWAYAYVVVADELVWTLERRVRQHQIIGRLSKALIEATILLVDKVGCRTALDGTAENRPLSRSLARASYGLRCTVDDRTGSHTVRELLSGVDRWLCRARREVFAQFEATSVTQVEIGAVAHHHGATLLAEHHATIETAEHITPAAAGWDSDAERHMRKRVFTLISPSLLQTATD